MRGACGATAKATAGLVALVISLGSGRALAGDKAVVTLPVEVQGDLGIEWRRALDLGVADGLARGKFEIVTSDRACDSPKCFTALAAERDATYLVRTIVSAEDRNYAVALTLIDGKTGEVTAEAAEVCEVCGLQQVQKVVADSAAALRTKLDALVAGPPVALIGSEPAGAIISIDGETAGQTPLRRELTEGKHLARAEKDGFITVEREFVAVAGVEERLDFELPPLPDIGPRFRPWGWVGVATGSAAIVAGATFWALDERPAPGERCRGDNVDGAGNCRFRYDTLAPGLVLTAAGAVLALAGTAILVAMRPQRRARRRLTWRPGGPTLTAHF
ncbi:MAG: PEGA domain-containing protein [Myxococcota bacterium]